MQQLSIAVNKQNTESLTKLLETLGAISVALTNAKQDALYQLNPTDTPLWDRTNVHALFNKDTDIKPIIHCITSIFQTIEKKHCHCEVIENKNWVQETQAFFKPQCFGEKLWVIPKWDQSKFKDNKAVIIEPGLAFGTGTHPTTALCLDWLALHPPQNLTVIDYGAGSGILSLAALSLGAKKVFAVDHDALALMAIKNNAKLNSFANPKNLDVLLPKDLSSRKVPLIIANILSNPLIELAPTLTALTKNNATLLLSGLLTTEIDRVYAAYANDFYLIQTIDTTGWAGLCLQRKKHLLA